MRMSAGIWSPDLTVIMSPITSSLARTKRCTPPRLTIACYKYTPASQQSHRSQDYKPQWDVTIHKVGLCLLSVLHPRHHDELCNCPQNIFHGRPKPRHSPLTFSCQIILLCHLRTSPVSLISRPELLHHFCPLSAFSPLNDFQLKNGATVVSAGLISMNFLCFFTDMIFFQLKELQSWSLQGVLGNTSGYYSSVATPLPFTVVLWTVTTRLYDDLFQQSTVFLMVLPFPGEATRQVPPCQCIQYVLWFVNSECGDLQIIVSRRVLALISDIRVAHVTSRATLPYIRTVACYYSATLRTLLSQSTCDRNYTHARNKTLKRLHNLGTLWILVILKDASDNNDKCQHDTKPQLTQTEPSTH